MELNDFFTFAFHRELSRFKYVNIRRNSAVFIHFFEQIFVNFDQIFVNIAQNMLQLLTVVLFILSLKIEEGSFIVRSEFLG